MNLPALSLIVIRAADIDASLVFYRAIGVVFVQEKHGAGPIHYSCEFAGLVLELYPDKTSSMQEANTDKTMLGFNVASLEQTLAELKKIGVAPKAEPKESPWGIWVNVLDPSGRTVQLSERVAQSAI